MWFYSEFETSMSDFSLCLHVSKQTEKFVITFECLKQEKKDKKFDCKRRQMSVCSLAVISFYFCEFVIIAKLTQTLMRNIHHLFLYFFFISDFLRLFLLNVKENFVKWNATNFFLSVKEAKLCFILFDLSLIDSFFFVYTTITTTTSSKIKHFTEESYTEESESFIGPKFPFHILRPSVNNCGCTANQ